MSNYTIGIFSMLNFIVHIYIGTHTQTERQTTHMYTKEKDSKHPRKNKNKREIQAIKSHRNSFLEMN